MQLMSFPMAMEGNSCWIDPASVIFIMSGEDPELTLRDGTCIRLRGDGNDIAHRINMERAHYQQYGKSYT